MIKNRVSLIFDEHHEGLRTEKEYDYGSFIPQEYLRATPLDLPMVSEGEVARHFVNISIKNHHVDKGFYPLGSCTMKYNPKLNESVAYFSGFKDVHPLQPVETVQGTLGLMFELGESLKELTGMDAVSLQPAAGAHGELTAMIMIRKFFDRKGEKDRKIILIPDSAHGTNPASVTLAGFKAVTIPSLKNGEIDIEHLKKVLSPDVAGLMVTNPNTLGIFESEIMRINELVHRAGGLVYMDGANMNALLGIVKPGDLGFDIMHLNLHKTFSTPHGGGGPGSGPVLCKNNLKDFLPVPIITKQQDGSYSLNFDAKETIGKMLSFYGNFLVMVRAYAYILRLGIKGLKRVSRGAIISANYLKTKISKFLRIPFSGLCMHEFVASGKELKKEYGVRTLDIAKRLLDYGFHAPTIYFPLIVSEAFMVEPTETESLNTLNRFIETLKTIIEEAKTDPDKIKESPFNTPIRRLDEVMAVKLLDVRS